MSDVTAPELNEQFAYYLARVCRKRIKYLEKHSPLNGLKQILAAQEYLEYLEKKYSWLMADGHRVWGDWVESK